MRIAVWYNLPSGGAKRALNDHLKGLKARGHEIEAWRPPVIQQDYLPVADLVTEHEVPLDDIVGVGKSYWDHVRRHLVRQFRMRQTMERHSRIVAAEIAKGGFDVLFANTCMHYHSPWLGRYLDLPKLLYLQEPCRVLYEAQPRQVWAALPDSIRKSWGPKALKRRAKDFIDIRAYRVQAGDELVNAESYDRILVNSNYSRESVLRAYGLHSEICYLGIDASRFEFRNQPRERFVMSIGAFVPSKDPEFVVRALATLPEPRPPLIWVANLVDAVYGPRIEALAKALGVDLQIRRYIPDAELIDLCNRASALLYSPRLEPFGYAPLEANACGCPAVVVAEGGVKESVANGINGIVVPRRPEAMGAAVARLLAGDEGLGVRAAAHVREAWSLNQATDELERNLREVAAKSASPQSIH